MFDPGASAQDGADVSGPRSSSNGGVLRGRGARSHYGRLRKIVLWSAVGLAAALAVTATFTFVPLSWRTVGSVDAAFLELRPPANGTIPGQGVLPVPSGEFCQGPPHAPSSAFKTGNATFTLAWQTTNGTVLSNFEIYVPSYMGIVPGTDVYRAVNASSGNFSQQVQGPGALCQWALDFEATFSSYDSVNLFVRASTTYQVAAPLL